MSILQEILNWSRGLQAWQSDAIARLFVKQTLSSDDVDDLLALLKTEHGIPDPKNRVAKKLSAQQIPVATKPNVHVEILAMKDLRHVNAIAEKQRLAFGAKGLTVIYGDNGSGKSGYSRVLKRACRARDQRELIHPNAKLPAGKIEEAEAIFELSIDGVPTEAKWVNDKPAPDELSSLAIFDARCARAYLDTEDDFSYIPYGIDILEELGRVCKRLEELIKKEHSQNAVDMMIFDGLADTKTRVGNLIVTLSAKTKRTQVEELANVGDAEIARHTELNAILKTENPKEKATFLRLRSVRIGKIAKAATEKLAIMVEVEVSKLHELSNAQRITGTAAKLAAQAFKSEATLLPGTGGEAWKGLFEAARVFCVEAHPTKEFPNLGSNAQCPLCQQPLHDGADRLLRFETFIQNEAEKTAQASRKEFEVALKIFSTHSLSLGLDDELFSELEGLDKTLAITTRDFELALAARHAAIKLACASDQWDKIASEPTSPATQLQTLADRLIQEATSLDKVLDETARAAMQSEYDEFEARLRLSKMRSAVLAAIEKLDLQSKLKNCLSAVKTTAISNKSNELAEKVISKELADSLNKEFKSLGAGNLKVSLQSHSERGKPLHKLKLELPQAKSLSDILSEGEQRAVAIGSFLAEVSIGGGTGGIVFDDPVSSLDHKRRELVASRMLEEATKRQVIVFTHDVYFLCILMDEARQKGIHCLPQSLARRPEGYGVAEPDLPFEGKRTKDRIGSLRNAHQQIGKLYKEGNENEHKKQTIDAYGKLRNAWERAVEEVLFADVVIRFRKGVETKRLVGVEVNSADYALIDSAISKCSNYTHDQALLGGIAIPDPDELIIDINKLDEWRIQVGKRSYEIAEKRKARSPATGNNTTMNS